MSGKSGRPSAKNGKSTPVRIVDETAASNVLDSAAQSCRLCDGYDNVDMVRCDNDNCKSWYHFECARVTREEVENANWECKRCAAKKPNAQEPETKDSSAKEPNAKSQDENPITSSAAKENVENKSTKSSSSSKTQKSKSRVSSSSKRKQLALERIEEERKLNEARDKEYLTSKYRVLEEMISSESEIEQINLDDDDLEQNAKNYTSEWVNKASSQVEFAEPSIDNPVGGKSVDKSKREVPQQTAGSQELHRTSYTAGFWQDYYNKLKIRHDSLPVVGATMQSGPVNGQQAKSSEVAGGARKSKFGLWKERQLEEARMKMAFGITSSAVITEPSTASTVQARDRRETTYSVFTSQAPINSSIMRDGKFGSPNQFSDQVTNVRSQSQVGNVNNQESFRFGAPFESQGAHSNPVYTSVQSSNDFRTDATCGYEHQPVSTNSYSQPSSTGYRPSYEQFTRSVPPISTSIPFSVSTSIPEQPILISLNGSKPSTSVTLTRPSFQHLTTTVGPNLGSSSNAAGGQIFSSSFGGQHLSGPSFVNANDTRPSTGLLPSQTFNNSAISQVNSRNISGRTSARLDADQIAARQAMPKHLPNFWGTPEEWPMFISAYENSTGACGYSNSENLGRLQDCLKGDTMDFVQCMLLHPDSVPDAIETLKLLFGRPEVIVETLMDKLQNETPPKESDLNALVKFALKVRNLVATVRKFGLVDHLNNPLLMKMLVNKLPTQTRLNWAYFKNSNPNANLANFGDWLYGLAQVTTEVIGRLKTDCTKKDRKENQKSEKAKSSHLNAQRENISRNEYSGSYGQSQQSGSNGQSQVSSTNQQISRTRKCPICSLESCKQIHDCTKLRSLSPKDRWEMVRNKRLCYSCFGKHRHFKCRSRKKCKIDGCESTHHALLHDNDRQSTVPNSNPSSGSKAIVPARGTNSANGTTSGNCNSLQSKRIPAIFKIVPVILYNKRNVIYTFAFLDGGSDLSLMERKLASELGLLGTPDILKVKWAIKNTEEETDTETVSVRISGDFKYAESYKINNVYTVDQLHLPSQSINKDWLHSYPHLKNLPIKPYENGTPRILLGLHCSKLMVSQETIEGGWSEPIACKTRLGWIAQGPDDNKSDASVSTFNFGASLNMCESYADNQLHQLVKEFFSFENCGIRVPEKLLESKEVVRAREIMEKTTVKKNGRYETGLLWRYDEVFLPDSYGMAMKRLISLENKMKRDPNLSKKLCDQMEDYVGKKYIRKLSSHEIEDKSPRTWYLPIFVVFNPKKPLKFRTVWDAAAKVKSVSLNSVLLKGPDQLVPLPDVLRRFRERLYGVTGDIGEMYHRVGVIEKDRCAQRFLWRDGHSDRQPDVYEMGVLTFGASCSPSSAQHVKNKNALEYKNKFPRAVEAIIDNTYIDDMLDSTDTKEEALSLLNDVKFIHKQASFEFGKITSNSMEILQAFGEEGNQQIKNLNLSPEITTERVLGMFWNTSSDMFTYSLKYAKMDESIMSGDRNPTKREVLRALMSIFDPLGLIANVLVHAKILLQKIWRKSTDWDQPISESLQKDWLSWIRCLPQVESLTIPRLYSPKLSPQRPKTIQMHTFVDAGLEACSATTYFRFVDEFGVDCALAGAKTKVAPNKPLTVPRLELQAAVLGTRLAGNIAQSQRFEIDKKFYWSDSENVLSWIMSESRKYTQFVAFRVGEILENSAEDEWNWVNSETNVADEATKSSNKPEISSTSRWFKGPSFLYQPAELWDKIIDKSHFRTDEELRPKYLLAQFVNDNDNIIDPNRFSSWKRLRRTLAFVFRFVNNLRTGNKNRQKGPLSRMEYVRAENYLYQQIQMDMFSDEIAIIRHNYGLPEDERKDFDKSSLLRTCSPYIDETGILRMKGRIDAAKHLTFQAKRPIILDRNHRITKLIVQDYHQRFHHLNHQTTLNELHQKYFIPALRRSLKGVIQNMCQRCKNDRANPKVPEMADLPPARIATFNKPFSYVGVDYFGPVMVKVNTTKRKRWVMLITCLTTRAVHMEVADAMTTNECIMAIRRFIARRGTPIEYYSDNGTNFHGSEKELRQEFEKLNLAKIEETFTDSVSQWKFNPPLAPHMGGSWERMIRTVKPILRKSLPTRIPTQKMFETFLAEAEYIINARPLTYVHLNHMEDEVLTPNHFLLGSSGGVRSPGKFDETCLLRDDWKAVQHMTDLFWRRFNIEYLPTIARRTKWFKDVKPIEKGDVVIIVDDKHDRNSWPKGIVEEVYPGRGNRVRKALVRLVRGRSNLSKIKVQNIKHQTLVRPVAKLAILDVKKEELMDSGGTINGREYVEDSRSAGQMGQTVDESGLD